MSTAAGHASTVPHCFLIGAGRGSPGLLTIRANDLLRQADLVIAPRGVASTLPDQASPGAERIELPFDTAIQPGDPTWERLRQSLEAGCRAVRLHRDEPLACPAGGQEAQALAAAGIPFEVVPGPAFPLAAASYAGIPLDSEAAPVILASAATLELLAEAATPDQAHSITQARVTTGSVGLVGRAPDGETQRQQGLLQRSTIVIPVRTRLEVASTAARLLRLGLEEATPAALVQRPGTPMQDVRLETLSAIAATEGRVVVDDAVLIVGDAVQRRIAWFERLPLFGKRVLVTRARDQAPVFSQALQALGAEPVELPVIEIVPPADPGPLDDAVARLGDYDWVVFTSANGVDAVFSRLDAQDRDARAFRQSKIAAIGTATAARLQERSLRADFIPERFVAEEIVDGLVARGIAGAKVVLPRAERAREVLPDGLRAAGATVDVVTAYRTVIPQPPPELIARVQAGQIDIVTFTSSSTVNNLVALLDGQVEPLQRATVACIGPITAKTAQDHGLQVDLVAEQYSIQGLLDGLVQAVERNQP